MGFWLYLRDFSMSTDPNPDFPVDIRGYVTDPKRVGYQVLTNYESIYWRALVGNDAWSLYEVLRSFCHNGNNACSPSIQLLTTILGLEDKRALIGRSKMVNDKEYRYPGLIETLQEHKLVIAEVQGEPPKTRYLFHVNLTPDLLTPAQVAQLPRTLQQKHAELLNRCAQEQRALEAKKKPSRFSNSNKNSSSDGAGGVGISHGGVGISHGGGGNFPPEQYPYNNTHITTGPRDDRNNNSSGWVSDKNDVVVALVNEQIAEKIAIRLAQRYSRERILEKIEYLAFLREQDPDRVKKPHGWLRRAIEENYTAPDGYQSPAERAAAAAEAQRRAAAEAQAAAAERRRDEDHQKQRQRQEADRLAALHTQYGTTQAELDLWQQILTEFEGTMPAATFHLHVANTVLLSLQDGQALIGLPNSLARDWLENRLGPKIQRTLASYRGGQKVTVQFIDLGTTGAANSRAGKEPAPEPE
jgi:hypothetical protein